MDITRNRLGEAASRMAALRHDVARHGHTKRCICSHYSIKHPRKILADHVTQENPRVREDIRNK